MFPFNYGSTAFRAFCIFFPERKNNGATYVVRCASVDRMATGTSYSRGFYAATVTGKNDVIPIFHDIVDRTLQKRSYYWGLIYTLHNQYVLTSDNKILLTILDITTDNTTLNNRYMSRLDFIYHYVRVRACNASFTCNLPTFSNFHLKCFFHDPVEGKRPVPGGFSSFPICSHQNENRDKKRLVLDYVIIYHTLLLYPQRNRADTAKRRHIHFFLC